MFMFRSPELVVYFYICLYVTSMGMIMMSSSMFIVWCLMEVSMLLFIAVSWGLSSNISYMMSYFLIQSFGSLMFLLPIFSNFSGFSIGIISIQVLVAISIKFGLFPFFSWYIPVMLAMPAPILFLVMTFQKLPSLFMASAITQNISGSWFHLGGLLSVVIFFLSLSVFLASFSSMLVSDVWTLYIVSSLIGGVWMYLISVVNMFLVVFYLVFYSFSLFLLMSFSLEKSNIKWLQSGMFLCFIGFPPLPIFMIKLVAVFLLLSIGGSSMNIMIFLLVIATVITMLFYLRQYLYLNSLNYYNSMILL